MKVITYQRVPRHNGDISEDSKTWPLLCRRALSWTRFNVPPMVTLCQLKQAEELEQIQNNISVNTVHYFKKDL